MAGENKLPLIGSFGKRLLFKVQESLFDLYQRVIALEDGGGSKTGYYGLFYPLSIANTPIPLDFFKENGSIVDTDFICINGALKNYGNYVPIVSANVPSDATIEKGLFIAYPDPEFNKFDEIATALNVIVDYTGLNQVDYEEPFTYSHLFLPILTETSLSFIDFGRFKGSFVNKWTKQ